MIRSKLLGNHLAGDVRWMGNTVRVLRSARSGLSACVGADWQWQTLNHEEDLTMTARNRKSREWYRERGRLPPEDFEALLAFRDRFFQRDGETEAEWLARNQRENIEYMAETDRLAAEDEAELG